MISHRGHRVRLLICLLSVAVVGCSEAKWVSFESKEDLFIAEFPGTPTREARTVSRPSGSVSFHVYSFTDTLTSTVFSVAMTDVGIGGFLQTAATLDGAKDGAVANTRGTLLSERRIRVVGQPGWEVKIATPDGRGTMRARLVLVADRLYQAVAVAPKDRSAGPSERFLKSLNFVRETRE